MKRTRSHHHAGTQPLPRKSAVSRAVRQGLRARHWRWHAHSTLVAASLLAVSTSALAQVPAQFELNDLVGANGFVVNGINPGDSSGISVSDAGDINGDGFADVIIGAGAAAPNGNYSGQSYVVFGSSAPPTGGRMELDSLDGNDGFALNGIGRYDYSGSDVSGAGDINGDGYSDLIIGAYPADGRSGQSYIVFGGASVGVGGVIELALLDGRNGFVLNALDTWNFLGYSVSGTGDVNGDGFDDLIVGAPQAYSNGSRTGQAYVVFGSPAVGIAGAINLSDLDGSNGFFINGINGNDWAGASVSDAGDVNGDGLADLIIGAFSADHNGDDSGASYVVLGRDTAVDGGFTPAIELSTLDGRNGFAIHGINEGDQSGRAVSGVGDVNGDGFDDVLIGAPGADPNGDSSGQSYVVFGDKNVGESGVIELAELDSTDGFSVNGINEQDRSGWAVSGASDVNGDRIADLIIGAFKADPNGSDSGQSYVVFGRNTAVEGNFPSAVELSSLDGSNGFALNGRNAGDLSGGSVSGAGDINGDGLADLIIGARWAEDTGQSYLVFGMPNLPSGFSSLAPLGDVTGNGSPDFAVTTLTGTIQVKSVDGTLVSQFSTVGAQVIAVEAVPDLAASPAPELATLNSYPDGAVAVSLYDTLTGAALPSIAFDPVFEPKAMAVLDDINDNGAADIAVLGIGRANGNLRATVKDAFTGQFIKHIWFDPAFTPVRLLAVPDLNDNGSQELALLGYDPVRLRSKVELRDGRFGTFLGNVWFDDDRFEPLDMALVEDINGDGIDEIAILGRNLDNGNVKATVKDLKTGQWLNQVWFGDSPPTRQLVVVPDFSGNGASEIGALQVDDTREQVRVAFRDSQTREWLGLVWANGAYAPADVAILPDVNGNGSAELAVLGDVDGQLRTLIKDSATDAWLGVVDFDP